MDGYYDVHTLSGDLNIHLYDLRTLCMPLNGRVLAATVYWLTTIVDRSGIVVSVLTRLNTSI